MTVLNNNQIWDRIYSKKENRLVITPIINEEQVGAGTVDLRLGIKFILFKNRRIRTINPAKETSESIREYQEEVVYPYGSEFILQPNQFILGSTVEYLKLPNDLLGYVLGRSSWGRLGLIIETSPVVQPNFLGILTLELSNLGTAPITLYPGSRIAQITLHLSEKPKKQDLNSFHDRKYHLSVSPEFSKIYTDTEMKKLQKKFI
jgi:dCTP deaminase